MRFRTRRKFWLIATAIGTACLIGCDDNDSPNKPVQPSGFYLGFTPFPYRLDPLDRVLDYVYDKIRLDANIIAHHFYDGEGNARKVLQVWRNRL